MSPRGSGGRRAGHQPPRWNTTSSSAVRAEVRIGAEHKEARGQGSNTEPRGHDVEETHGGWGAGSVLLSAWSVLKRAALAVVAVAAVVLAARSIYMRPCGGRDGPLVLHVTWDTGRPAGPSFDVDETIPASFALLATGGVAGYACMATSVEEDVPVGESGDDLVRPRGVREAIWRCGRRYWRARRRRRPRGFLRGVLSLCRLVRRLAVAVAKDVVRAARAIAAWWARRRRVHAAGAEGGARARTRAQGRGRGKKGGKKGGRKGGVTKKSKSSGGGGGRGGRGRATPGGGAPPPPPKGGKGYPSSGAPSDDDEPGAPVPEDYVTSHRHLRETVDMASDPQARALVETVDRLVPVCTNQRKLGMRTMTALVIHRFDVYLHHPNVPRNEDGMPVYNVAVFMRYVWTTAVADMFSRSSGPRFWVSMAYRGMADPQNEHAVCKHTRLEIQGSAGFTATLPACNDRRQVEAILGARDDDAFVFPERAMREIFQALASQLVLNIVHHVTVPFVRRARQHLLGLCRDIVPGARLVNDGIRFTPPDVGANGQRLAPRVTDKADMSKSLLWSWVAAGEEWATPWAPPGNAGAYVLGLHETLRGRLASLAQAERAAVEAALRRVYRQARATRAAMVTAPGGGLAADRFYSRVPYHPSQVTPQLFFWHLYMLHWRTVRGRGLARVTLAPVERSREMDIVGRKKGFTALPHPPESRRHMIITPKVFAHLANCAAAKVLRRQRDKAVSREAIVAARHDGAHDLVDAAEAARAELLAVPAGEWTWQRVRDWAQRLAGVGVDVRRAIHEDQRDLPRRSAAHEHADTARGHVDFGLDRVGQACTLQFAGGHGDRLADARRRLGDAADAILGAAETNLESARCRLLTARRNVAQPPGKQPYIHQEFQGSSVVPTDVLRCRFEAMFRASARDMRKVANATRRKCRRAAEKLGAAGRNFNRRRPLSGRGGCYEHLDPPRPEGADDSWAPPPRLAQVTTDGVKVCLNLQAARGSPANAWNRSPRNRRTGRALDRSAPTHFGQTPSPSPAKASLRTRWSWIDG